MSWEFLLADGIPAGAVARGHWHADGSCCFECCLANIQPVSLHLKAKIAVASVWHAAHLNSTLEITYNSLRVLAANCSFCDVICIAWTYSLPARWAHVFSCLCSEADIETQRHAGGEHMLAGRGVSQGLGPTMPAWLSMAHAVIAATTAPQLMRPASGLPSLPTGCLYNLPRYLMRGLSLLQPDGMPFYAALCAIVHLHGVVTC